MGRVCFVLAMALLLLGVACGGKKAVAPTIAPGSGTTAPLTPTATPLPLPISATATSGAVRPLSPMDPAHGTGSPFTPPATPLTPSATGWPSFDAGTPARSIPTPPPSQVSTATATVPASPTPSPTAGSASDQDGIQSAEPVGDLCPTDYPIEGDATARFHLPADPDYAATSPVVCFATVDDATAAGYRPAHAG